MEKRTVRWFMQNKGLVQFEEENDAQYISDAVANFLGDNSLKEGESVEVEFGNDSDGEKNVVKIMRPKTQEKTERKAQDKKEENLDLNIRELTVGGISYKKGALFFKEECDSEGKASIWYDVNIEECKSKGISKDVKVKVSCKDKEKGRNKLITSIEKIESPKEDKKEEVKTKNTYQKNSDSVQSSIEAQASVNAANHTVARLFTGFFDPNKSTDGETVKTLIKVLANHNFELIQELKNK